MDPIIENDDSVLCSNCGTRNSFGSYECINCREILSYADTDEPYIDVTDENGKENVFYGNRFRRSLFYIPPFILLLIMLTAYLIYDKTILLILTIVIFLPWAAFCAIDIHNTSKRRNELKKLDSP